jgi:CzcA family heavy metal efflux pump
VIRGNRTLALFIALGAAVLGGLLAPSIPSSVFPELVFPRAIVMADSGELPREQTMVAVTRPLEEAAYGVTGTRLVRSTTTRGSAEIDVTFTSDSDPITGFQLLNAALVEARGRLPAGTTVDARLLTTGTFPILDLSLSSRVRDLAELTDIAFYDLVPGFHRIPGVYRVELVGGKQREFVVRLDPPKMLSYNLTPRQVVSGLAAANVIASAGRIFDAHRMLLTVVSSDLHTREQLAAVPIATLGGQPVHVSEIGSVELGIREDYIRAASEHGPSVLVGISRQPGGNAELIARQARALVDGFRRRYPDVDFSFSYDQSALVRESFQSVRDAILLGLVLSVAVVFAFTLSPISALVAGMVVPACILATCAVMKAGGMTFNMMTLGGLAAGIGLFIDDAIVMLEAIHRRRAAGQTAAEAGPAALRELARPLIASTATVIVVFAPLVILSGVTGTFFRALAATLGAGLAISLMLAIFVTPTLEAASERWRGRAHAPGRAFGLIRDGYVMLLRPFLAWPALSILLSVGAIALAYRLFGTVGADYLPALDEGAFILDFNTPPPSTMDDTEALLRKFDGVLKTTPEVVSFSRRTGTQLGFFLTESNHGDISVRLKSGPRRDIDDIIDSMRDRILSTVPGVRIEFSQVLQDLIGDLSGTPEPVEVKVFGSDQATIEATAREIAARMRRIPGLVDVFDGIVLSNPEQEILVDETAAARYRISAADIHAALETVIAGTVATDIRIGDRLIGVRVRYPDAFHQDLSALSGVLLNTPDNGRVPLGAVAVSRWAGERAQLARERMRPVVRVTARLSNIDLGAAIAQVRQSLATIVLPAGVSLEYGGLYAEQQQAFGELTMVLIVGAIGVFIILLWEFGRMLDAMAVMAAALPCLAGSMLALAATGITLNISSFMGIIMVVGIAAKNGILFLDHAEHGIAEEQAPTKALIEAARVRIRPILMTTMATAAGLLPLALGFGAGARVQQPLAVAVIGGLVFSMLFSIPLAAGVFLIRPGLLRRRLERS